MLKPPAKVVPQTQSEIENRFSCFSFIFKEQLARCCIDQAPIQGSTIEVVLSLIRSVRSGVARHLAITSTQNLPEMSASEPHEMSSKTEKMVSRAEGGVEGAPVATEEEDKVPRLPNELLLKILETLVYTRDGPDWRTQYEARVRRRTLSHFLQASKDCFELGLPLFMSKIDLLTFIAGRDFPSSEEVESGQKLIEQFSKDRLGSKKFGKVKELVNLGIAELTNAELAVLSESGSNVEKVKVRFAIQNLRTDPKEYEKRAIKLFIILNTSCKALRELEIEVDRYDGPWSPSESKDSMMDLFTSYRRKQGDPEPVIQLFRGAGNLPSSLERLAIHLPILTPYFDHYGILSSTIKPILLGASKLPKLKKVSICYDPRYLDLSPYRNLFSKLDYVELDAELFPLFARLKVAPRRLFLDNATWLRVGAGEEFESEPDTEGNLEIDLSKIPQGIETLRLYLCGSNTLVRGLPRGLQNLILEDVMPTTKKAQLPILKRLIETAISSGGLKFIKIIWFVYSSGDVKPERKMWEELQKRFPAVVFVQHRE